ncbi:glycoside hydrolase family 114 protein [Flagelloscypha sp. PMI_526]|nr:glycoside hydrolase family 114 protein [Flagelloscypha sp. PMI_526]
MVSLHSTLPLVSFAALAMLSPVLAAPRAQEAIKLFDPSGDFDYQIGGSFTPDSSVKTVSRDYESGEVAKGLYNVCYINAFQSQPGEALAWWEKNAKDLLLQKNGKPYLDPDWDEYIFDTTTDAKRQALAKIVKPWIDTCAKKGFNAIEPDNLDTFTRFQELSQAGNLAFARILSDYAHSLGMAFAQKNTASLTSADKIAGGFDFAVAEECANFKECSNYTSLYGNYVLEIEYSDVKNAESVYSDACKALGSKIPITYRDRKVAMPSDKSKYVNRHC